MCHSLLSSPEGHVGRNGFLQPQPSRSAAEPPPHRGESGPPSTALREHGDNARDVNRKLKGGFEIAHRSRPAVNDQLGGGGAAEWRTAAGDRELGSSRAAWEPERRGSGRTPVRAVRRVLALPGAGCVPGGLFHGETCLARSRALPRDARRARLSWKARGQQDAPGPGQARVRVCARRGEAGRVHGTGGTRARAGAAERKKRTKPRSGEPSGCAGPYLRPAVQRANTEPLHHQPGKEAARLSAGPGRALAPRASSRPSQQSARPLARTLARSPSDLGNHSPGRN